MSAPTSPTPSPLPQSWPEFSVTERRLLGVLVEKAKTTPDAYPMSVNSLVTGSNQKSNRDPLLNLTEEQVEDGLGGLQKKGLAIRITGGRVERWRHNLYEVWRVNKVELAVLGELLLRGPQTEGELRTRASRMEPIEDLDALRPVLRGLAERKLIVYLTPEGRRGTMVTHGFHGETEVERLKKKHEGEAREEVEDSRPVARVEVPDGGWKTEATALRQEISELRERLEALAQTVKQLKDGLGG